MYGEETVSIIEAHDVAAPLFLYVALMLVLNHIPYEYFQPYIESVLAEQWQAVTATPLITGLHVAVTFWLASLASGRSIRRL